MSSKGPTGAGTRCTSATTNTSKTIVFDASPALIRRAVESHREWIEHHVGNLGELAILNTDLNLAQVGIKKILNSNCAAHGSQHLVHRLDELVTHAEIPQACIPIFGWEKAEPSGSLEDLLLEPTTTGSDLQWLDCPVLLRVKDIASPIIAINIYFHDGPQSISHETASVLVVRRDCINSAIAVLQDVSRPSRRPQLVTWEGATREVAKYSWDQLVLAPETIALLKNDMDSFFEREKWFKEKHLPYRRGYLLHGPPGNGKTSTIKAMLNAHALTAYTLRLSHPRTSDGDLEKMFERALTQKPAVVLFEDLDRFFPHAGQPQTKVSLQSLLNAIDGIATGSGLIVIATANNPSVLDPAILRRPGRFDRIVKFANPSAELRLAYFKKLGGILDEDVLRSAVERSEGFSFAQLQEAYIIGGQMAFERRDDVKAIDLLIAIDLMRRGNAGASSRPNVGGFRHHQESQL